MVMDIEFAYEIGDMVRFVLMRNGQNIFTGFIAERWITKTEDRKYPIIKLYRILCLDKSLVPYTIIEELILERT
jgi:hypothetical protein